jgi:RHS repeat-associated protein
MRAIRGLPVGVHQFLTCSRSRSR